MLSFSSLFSIPTIFKPRPGGGPINIQPVRTINVEVEKDRRGRSLKHLLKLNHANHAILFHDLQFHNHLPHILGSAYLLGSSNEHLDNIYDGEAEELEKWKESPGEVSRHDWQDYLGRREYQRAFVDLFEDELVHYGYDWRKVVEQYLFKEKHGLFSSLISGLAHPLIHLGYAMELNSKEVAMEALGLAATCYDLTHKYIDDPKYSTPSSWRSKSLLEILNKVRSDDRFDSDSNDTTSGDIESLFGKHEQLVLEYWNSWDLETPTKQFGESQFAATSLLCATVDSSNPVYDFFVVHTLTSSHAVRIILPSIPASHHVAMVRQWWLFTLAVYITQSRPKIDLELVSSYALDGRDWDWVDKEAISGKRSLDAHFVKALRAMKEAGRTWGNHDEFQLKAAVKFADQFSGWFGFAEG